MIFVRKISINLKTSNFRTQGREWDKPVYGEKSSIKCKFQFRIWPVKGAWRGPRRRWQVMERRGRNNGVQERENET